MKRLPDRATFTAMLDAAGIKYEYQARAVAVRSGPDFAGFFFTPAGRFTGFVVANEESAETVEFWGRKAP